MKLILPTHLKMGIKKPKNFTLSMNNYRNWHYQTSNKLKQMYKDIVSDQNPGKIESPYQVHLVFHYNRADQDKSNFTALAMKFTLDALIELGCIEEDNISHEVRELSEVGSRDKEGYIEFTINSTKDLTGE